MFLIIVLRVEDGNLPHLHLLRERLGLRMFLKELFIAFLLLHPAIKSYDSFLIPIISVQ